MDIQVRRVAFNEIEGLRDLYRQEIHCQMRRDPALARGLADPYLILAEGRIAGHGGVLNRHESGRLMEFYTLPNSRPAALRGLRPRQMIRCSC